MGIIVGLILLALVFVVIAIIIFGMEEGDK